VAPPGSLGRRPRYDGSGCRPSHVEGRVDVVGARGEPEMDTPVRDPIAFGLSRCFLSLGLPRPIDASCRSRPHRPPHLL
jgi:hypothetical protein